MPEEVRQIMLAGDLAQSALLIGVFYLHLYLLRSGYGRKGKVALYIFSVLGMLIVFLVAVFCVRLVIFPGIMPPPITWFSVFDFSFITVVATTYHLLLERVERQQQQREMENENLKTELAFLRSQMSPHFVFNVLNNMVAMARFQSPQLEPSLIRLSGIMRYMVYESNNGKVPLQKEVEYLKSYIDLQELRFSDSMLVVRNLEQVNSEMLIEPMLLIPFVENAFKHGRVSSENGQINVSLQVKENEMHFSVTNKIGLNKEPDTAGSSGIGLANVKRRLELLYPGRYQLFINPTEEVFSVGLQIQLS